MLLSLLLVFSLSAGAAEYGDVNGDGAIDSMDISQFVSYILGKTDSFSGAEDPLDVGDLNGDEEINSQDFSYLQQYILGDIDEFPAEDTGEETEKTLTISVDGAGSVSPEEGEHTYDEGEEVAVSATPEDEWSFVEWQGDVADPESSETEVVMDEDKDISAEFEEEGTPSIISESSTIYDTMQVAEEFTLINNAWGAEDADQTIIEYEDGSYGFEWERGDLGSDEPNYPEVLVGVKPWGDEQYMDSGLPLRLDEIETLEMELDLVQEIFEEEGEWNLSFELWITGEEPGYGNDVSETITDEIMIWFDWADGHYWESVDPYMTDAIEDGDTVYDYNVSETGWGDDGWIGGGWHYSQFLIDGKGEIPDKIDLKKFVDMIIDEHDRDEEYWLGALEMGMEYGDNTAGRVRIKELDYNINGNEVESGIGH
ncbi:MAG: dockerin type I domain-containing protein [Halanaerobiaceae bacterium]